VAVLEAARLDLLEDLSRASPAAEFGQLLDLAQAPPEATTARDTALTPVSPITQIAVLDPAIQLILTLASFSELPEAAHTAFAALPDDLAMPGLHPSAT